MLGIKNTKYLSIKCTLRTTIHLKTTTRATYAQMDTQPKNLAEYALSLYPVVLAVCFVIEDKWTWGEYNKLYNSVTRTCKLWRGRNVEWATCARYSTVGNTSKWRVDIELHTKFLQRVHTLVLRDCIGVRDVSALGGVHTLDLRDCTSVCDVSALGHVYKLDLAWCASVCDVSALGHVHILDLYKCTGVRDVSALGRVHTIDLSWCTGVRDVSALGSLHTLSLWKCTEVSDTSMLGGVHNLEFPNGEHRVLPEGN
jgi:hypothetical protein